MRRFLPVVCLLLLLCFGANAQTSYTVSVGSGSATTIQATVQATTVTVKQLGTPLVSFTVSDPQRSPSVYTVNAGATYVFGYSAGYAVGANIGTLQSSSGTITIQVTMNGTPPVPPKSCPGGQAIGGINPDGSVTCTSTSGAVTSVFGRAGSVSAQTGDYGFSQISGSAATSQLPTSTVNNRGAYNPATSYNVSDLVQYAGSSYVALLSNTGVVPGSDNVTWAIAAAAGSNGTNGVNGVSGTNGYSPNQMTSGCGIHWTSNYNFTVGACSYFIGNVQYASAITNETLAAADPSNNRLDTFFVDNTGSVGVITGTPAATPVVPSVDPTTQLFIGFVQVDAGSTAPSTITTDNIFDECTEWTEAKSGSPINTCSTNNPYHLTKDVEATTAVIGNYIQFTKPASGTVDLATRNLLILYLRSKATWSTTRSLTVQWYNGSTAKGLPVVIQDGQFGFSSAKTSAYQQISIPTSLFAANGIPVTTVRLTVSGPSGAATIGWYLDYIFLQGGISGPVLPSNLMVFRGTYSATTAYNPNDVVVSGNVTYVCIVPNINQAVSSTTYWQPFNVDASNASNISSGTLASARLPSTAKQRILTFSYGDPANAASITAGTTATDYGAPDIPFACTISRYAVMVDSGTVTVKFWKVASGTSAPGSGNSINTSGVGVSSGSLFQSTTLTDFTSTSVSAHDAMAMNVTAATAKFVSAMIECDQP